MSTVKFRLNAATRASDVHSEIGQNYGAIRDMLANRTFGEHVAELGRDAGERDDQDLPRADAGIEVIYLPGLGRAAIDDNAGTHWTDADSVEDAIRRFREDDLSP